MEGSVGKALREARLKKKLTVEEAARVLKMRPDRVADLEKDEYGRFPNLAYARSFLLLYAKFLGVDVSRFQTVDVGNSAGVGDYQYLQNERGVDSLRFSHEHAGPPRRPRWILPFLVLMGGLLLGAVMALIVLNVNRLPSLDQLLKKHESGDLATPTPSRRTRALPSPAAAEPQPPQPSPPESMEAQPPLSSDASLLRTFPGESPAVPPTPTLPGLSPNLIPGPTLSPIPGPTPSPEVRRAEPVTPPEEPVHEVKIRVSRKTRVKILRDDVSSGPVYDDWLAPGMPPLTFRGRYFWIETRNPRDREALQVTRDGSPVDAASLQKP